MSKVKEIAEISQEIIQKLDEAITQTINARLFYEKYKSLLDKAKEIHEQKYVFWSECGGRFDAVQLIGKNRRKLRSGRHC